VRKTQVRLATSAQTKAPALCVHCIRRHHLSRKLLPPLAAGCIERNCRNPTTPRNVIQRVCWLRMFEPKELQDESDYT
jgi:hypothetical protein